MCDDKILVLCEVALPGAPASPLFATLYLVALMMVNGLIALMTYFFFLKADLLDSE